MKVVKFSNWIDFNKRLGKVIITGKEGAGKTLLLSRMCVEKMLHGMEDCWKSYPLVDKYNEMGFNFSKNYNHLAFSNIPVNCKRTFIPDRESYVVNPYRLGLFDNLFDTDFYPPYSAFFITESYNYLNSYLFNKFRDSFKGFMKTCRQAKFDIVVDAHSVSDICTLFKRLTNRFIHLYKDVEHILNRDGVVIGHKLFCYQWTDYCDVVVFETSKKLQNYEEFELVIDGCFFDNYDTEFCRFLHLEGREFQDFCIKLFDFPEKYEDLFNFGEKFGILPPEGFFVSKARKTVETNTDTQFNDETEEDDGWEEF